MEQYLLSNLPTLPKPAFHYIAFECLQDLNIPTRRKLPQARTLDTHKNRTIQHRTLGGHNQVIRPRQGTFRW
eukprot:scaffold76_cov363-Pavlova_lutheri.AAC.6